MPIDVYVDGEIIGSWWPTGGNLGPVPAQGDLFFLDGNRYRSLGREFDEFGDIVKINAAPEKE